ncbi:MAG: response regulator transcription factor [Acidobacteriota bacterium]
MRERAGVGGRETREDGLIRVTVIEDQQPIRDGLCMLIAGTPGFVCAGSYESMEAALAGIDRAVPDIAMVDIALPGMTGIEGIRLLKQRHPNLVALMLTVYDDDERIFDALCAGACGYMLKNTPPARLLESIREAVDGGAPMSPEVARRVIELFRQVRPPASAEHDLTPHERRLLKMLVEGHNYTTAAQELGVSINTISFHMRHIYDKLHVHSKSQAVAKALRDGLVK